MTSPGATAHCPPQPLSFAAGDSRRQVFFSTGAGLGNVLSASDLAGWQGKVWRSPIACLPGRGKIRAFDVRIASGAFGSFPQVGALGGGFSRPLPLGEGEGSWRSGPAPSRPHPSPLPQGEGAQTSGQDDVGESLHPVRLGGKVGWGVGRDPGRRRLLSHALCLNIPRQWAPPERRRCAICACQNSRP